MRRELIFIIFVAILLVVSGCDSKGKKKKTVSVGFIGGQEGITSTLEIFSSEPNAILDNNVEPFQIIVNLENEGEHTVNTGEVMTTLTGIDLNAFQIAEKKGVSKNLDQLDKKSFENGKELPTAKTQIIYEANYKYDEPTSKNQQLGVNVCYKYRTLSTSDACLKKSVNKPSSEGECKVGEQKIVGNSGAPVGVTLLNEKVSQTNLVSFVLEISNLGKGEVYTPDFLSQGLCIPETSNTIFKNKLKVKLEFADGNPLIKCPKLNNGNEGLITMVQNKALLTCTADTSSLQDSAFTKSLKTTLDYVYMDEVSTQITIKSTT